MITHKQLSLADIFSDCQNKFDNDKYQFLALLENTINLDEIVPASFISHFHAATGRPRKHLLYPMLRALLLQLIFSIPTTSLLIISTYKIRVNVEKSINHFKDSFCVAGRKTQNEKTLHADLLLAGIAQLVTVMVADKIHKHQYIRSLKPLIA